MAHSELWCRVTVMGPGGSALLTWPVIGAGHPDLDTVDALARLQLAMVRRGNAVRLTDVSDDLDALLYLTGLGRDLGRQREGQPERREDVADVEECVERRDPAVGNLDDL